jgi:hypothetical protein
MRSSPYRPVCVRIHPYFLGAMIEAKGGCWGEIQSHELEGMIKIGSGEVWKQVRKLHRTQTATQLKEIIPDGEKRRFKHIEMSAHTKLFPVFRNIFFMNKFLLLECCNDVALFTCLVFESAPPRMAPGTLRILSNMTAPNVFKRTILGVKIF